MNEADVSRVHSRSTGIMASVRKSDLEKTKLLQCESTVKDWEDQSKKVYRTESGALFKMHAARPSD